ncbi:MAG: Na+/H+ antiporter NhaA [Flavobacterium sp.]
MLTDFSKSPSKKWVTNPLNILIHNSAGGGIVLFLSAIFAVFMANSPWSDWYLHLWENKFTIGINNHLYLNKTLHHWINDGLMSIFFFVVGLELKRELIAGELSNPKMAILPIGAALGGMLVPALIYIFFNSQGETFSGWGIPMATDIAFALGVMHLLGDKIPTPLKVFLTALAIVDDLGAVLVIAFFYTSNISLFNLGIAFGFLAFLVLANRMGIRNTYFYGIIGIGGVWLFFLMSGIHATIAAVLIAFTIPATAKVDENTFLKKMNCLLDKFKNSDKNESINLTGEQLQILEDIRKVPRHVIPPLQRLEQNLHSFVTFAVMPVFALANAGVPIFGNSSANSSNTVMIGVALGLLIGKFIGVVGFSTLLVKLKIAEFPNGITTRQLVGVGLLASIGFTMSLFVTNLAFTNQEYILQAKIGIFIASLIGGISGYLVLNKK